MQFPDFKNELKRLAEGFACAAGCDEVGRAPLAGPVVAAACILDPASIGRYRSKNKWYARVRDSKTTSAEEREILAQKILKHTLAWGVGEVWQAEIDKINIHHASLEAMRRAVENMRENFSSEKIFLFVDGKFKIPKLNMTQENIIDGDAKVLSISAASIIAKVHRDGIMKKLHQKFPNYGFATHKGYPTRAHKAAIAKWGIQTVHRKSFIKSLS